MGDERIHIRINGKGVELLFRLPQRLAYLADLFGRKPVFVRKRFERNPHDRVGGKPGTQLGRKASDFYGTFDHGRHIRASGNTLPLYPDSLKVKITPGFSASRSHSPRLLGHAVRHTEPSASRHRVITTSPGKGRNMPAGVARRSASERARRTGRGRNTCEVGIGRDFRSKTGRGTGHSGAPRAPVRFSTTEAGREEKKQEELCRNLSFNIRLLKEIIDDSMIVIIAAFRT